MIYDIVVRILADGMLLPIVIIGTYMLIAKVPNNRKFESYKRVLIAGLTAYMIAKFASIIYQPTDLRPFEIMGLSPGASYLNNPGFPSDHALFAAAITLAVWFETRDKKVTLIMAIMVGLLCLGRVLALVHSPVDVIAGVLIAFTGALWYEDWRGK